MLYIVATPIGNLKDITLRALEILQKVDLILAEDTRKTGKLLNNYNIDKSLESFYEHNEEIKKREILEKLKTGLSIALVSDAGTPLISDPGYKLVREAIKLGIKVESIPGPSSILAALTSSGLPINQFMFLGYLPKKESKQNEIFDFINLVSASKPTTFILFESPFRITKTLQKLKERFPQKEIVIARELTKIHEEFIRGKVSEVAEKKIKSKGEFTLLLY